MRAGIANRMRSAAAGQKGSVLLLTIFLIAFSALLVGGLLHALSTDFQIVNNHLRSTQALYVTDAGIEDALAALRLDYTWAEGFTQKAFPAGDSSYYTVTVANTYPNVVITSTGIVAGFERKAQAKIRIAGTSAPYPMRVLYWTEL